MSTEDVIAIGFKPIQHFTVTDAHLFDLGRDRHLSIGCVGTPNEMLWICSLDGQRVTDLVCLHNWDYDGPLNIEKLTQFVQVLSPVRG